MNGQRRAAREESERHWHIEKCCFLSREVESRCGRRYVGKDIISRIVEGAHQGAARASELERRDHSRAQ